MGLVIDLVDNINHFSYNTAGLDSKYNFAVLKFIFSFFSSP